MKRNRMTAIAMAGVMFAGGLGAFGYRALPASAGHRVDTKTARVAAHKASRALAARHWDEAVGLAEAAVAASPQDAGYRALLGQAYLRAGRFVSADQALGEALTLAPGDARVALNRALAQIAAGRWDAARATLALYSETIAPADRGLALALSGDPALGVEVLTAAAHSPQADAKTRQNLALALALAGRWPEARATAAVDLSPLEADARLRQWAGFARPESAGQQVAALLGITPANDPGQPAALALATPAPAMTPAPIEQAAAEAAPPSPAATASLNTPRIVFGARQEVVQPLPPAPAAISAPVRSAARDSGASRASASPSTATSGKWVVQIGAYDNAAVAHDGWTRATRRLPALAARVPLGMTARVRGSDFYRLAVGGLARRDAAALCRDYRAHGGACFVRAGGGDQVAAWHRPARGGVQVAAR